MTDPSAVALRPAATVILLREIESRLHALLLKRNAGLAFHGGSWVFPGGRIDDEDYQGTADDERAARIAAVREAEEEAGLVLSPDDLIHFAHWTTPVGNPKRFSTWFYAAPAHEGEVEIDGGEIHDHQWATPDEALALQVKGEIALPAPTFVSLLKLRQFSTVSDALAGLRDQALEVFVPRIHQVEGGRLSVYQQDAGYESGELESPGPRHRLWMVESGWHYENEF